MLSILLFSTTGGKTALCIKIKAYIINFEMADRSFLFLFSLTYSVHSCRVLFSLKWFILAMFHYTGPDCLLVFVYAFQLTSVNSRKDYSTYRSSFCFAGTQRFQCLKQHLFKYLSAFTFLCRNKKAEIKIKSKESI